MSTPWNRGVSLATLGTAAALATAAFAASRSVQQVEPTLTKVVDHREAILVETAPQAFGFDHVGLVLTFDLNLPPELRLASLDQPERITSEDATGIDLTRVRAQFGAGPEFVSPLLVWDEPVRQFEFKLSSPDRRAEFFDLRAVVNANVFSTTEDLELEAGPSATRLEPDMFGTGFSIRAEQAEGQTSIVFTPGTTRDLIESIEIIDAGMSVPAGGSSWNESMVSYYFPATTSGTVSLNIKARRGYHQIPLIIDLRSTPLP